MFKGIKSDRSAIPSGERRLAALRRRGRLLSLDDFEIEARRFLPRPLFAYVSGGVEDNVSRTRNRLAFQKLQLLPRCAVNVSKRSTETELLGTRYAAPFGIAPMGLCAITAFRGDLVLAEGAKRAGIPMIISGSALTPLEAILDVNPDAWFQAYLPGDERRRADLVERVRAAGVETLVVTVDVPVSGNRENNLRAGFSTPLRPGVRLARDGLMRPRWLFGTLLRTLALDGMPHFENSFATRGAPIVARRVEREFAGREFLTWADIKSLRKRWGRRLIVKGILSPADAKIARDLGADGIVVSNHGGRQLDTAASPIDALPAIAEALADFPIMLDGGIRRGTDILKAFALGARFVFVGRPFNYAAGLAGLAGLLWAFELLRGEVHRDLALLGVNRMSEINEAVLFRSR